VASSSHLKPGERGKIDVKLEAEEYSGDIVKRIGVFSNDPKQPSKVLFIRGKVF
jgi:hypothetical protein